MARGDVTKAKEIIELYTSYMELPDADPIKPTTMEQMKSVATDVFSWVRDNREDIMSTIDYLRSFRKTVPTKSIPTNNIPKL